MLTTCSSNGRRSRPPLAAKCRGRVAHRLTRGYEDGGGVSKSLIMRWLWCSSWVQVHRQKILQKKRTR